MSVDRPPRVAPRSAPLFLFVCEDGPDGARLRAERLADHLAYVEARFARYVAAGPLKSDAAGAPCASFFLIEAADEADADALMAGDPYMAPGLYASVRRWRATAAAGSLLGGVIWP